MSVSYLQIQRALRATIKTLEVATTDFIDLGATATSFTRAAGSFITDRFFAGMEVVTVGFCNAENNGTFEVIGVSALELRVNATLVVESDVSPFSCMLWGDAGLWTGIGYGVRRCLVGLPLRREWDNEVLTPITGRPYVEEQLVPGPVTQVTLGELNGELELTPLYVIHLSVPEGNGSAAANTYADAILRLFKAHSTMALDNGDVLRVRSDPAPYREKLNHRKPGWASVPVTIPLRMRTINS